jgi:vancomycin permeability regulator SanA
VKKLLKNKKVRIALWITAGVLALCILFVLVCNIIVLATAAPMRYHEDTLPAEETYDCILVLGAGVKEDGSLSNLLRDRMTVGVSLMKKGFAPVMLLTGDSHEAETYDEVGTMTVFATENGVSADTILQDPLGLSTYESLWRAKNVYGMKKILIVTQGFHLDRALYLADCLGLECHGVKCDITMALPMNYFREWAARIKAVYQGITLPEINTEG